MQDKDNPIWEQRHLEKKSLLCSIRDILKDINESVKVREPMDIVAQISANNPLVLDYKNRYFIFVWSANALTLTIEDLGSIGVAAGTWTNLSFQAGTRIYASGQNSLVPIFVRCTDVTY